MSFNYEQAMKKSVREFQTKHYENQIDIVFTLLGKDFMTSLSNDKQIESID